MKLVITMLTIAALNNALNVQAGCYFDAPYVCRTADSGTIVIIIGNTTCTMPYNNSTGFVTRATGNAYPGLDNIYYVNNDCCWTSSYTDCNGNPQTDTNCDST